jgi:hypothetical protein
MLADVCDIGGSERRPWHHMRIDDGAVFGVDFALHGYQRAAGDLIGKKLRSGPGAVLFALGLIQGPAASGTDYRRVTKFLTDALGIDLALIGGIRGGDLR